MMSSGHEMAFVLMNSQASVISCKKLNLSTFCSVQGRDFMNSYWHLLVGREQGVIFFHDITIVKLPIVQ